ncbi:uncharacterized protein LOC100879516 isoform X2 [Megachile rotundata]|uniref:uncharacterized protein LOC100879516 isoform X2 n=1 Tax=Megachile rotundata TaxID=143995 RepID=UPI000614E9E2|nr:PREDICTED: uncharacterized protein LOC100879516 isoform X2 [Megachile rotundata]
MGIDSMRVGGGRCPPLLVGGLLVACLMLICNWWTLSSENIELVRQIDELNEQLKISGEERDQCVTLRGNLEERFKHAEGELDSLKKLDAGKNVTIETLRLEKNNFKTQLVTTRDENKKLQEEIEQIKDDLNKAKLNCGTTPPKKVANISQPARPVINKSQLGPVPESAVRISLAGQRGLKYHGIPILPKDPPGAVRLSPRVSVTMLKVETNPKDPTNNASNEGTMLNNPELEEEDKNGSNKQENTGSTDANLKETFRLYE